MSPRFTFLKKEEFEALGFDPVEDYDKLAYRASLQINEYINRFYDCVDFDTDYNLRKRAVKLACAYQIKYLNDSGVMTAEDKQMFASVRIGRTSVSGLNRAHVSNGDRFNLCKDAEAILDRSGFGYSGVYYDR